MIATLYSVPFTFFVFKMMKIDYKSLSNLASTHYYLTPSPCPAYYTKPSKMKYIAALTCGYNILGYMVTVDALFFY